MASADSICTPEYIYDDNLMHTSALDMYSPDMDDDMMASPGGNCDDMSADDSEEAYMTPAAGTATSTEEYDDMSGVDPWVL